MRVLKWIAIPLCVLALLAAGCSGRRPLNVNSPVLTSKGTPSEAEVLKAIERAAKVSQWEVLWTGSGNLVVQRVLGSHSARVHVTYSPTHYSISLDQTTMLDQPQQIGFSAGSPGGAAPSSPPRTVHRTYNVWVQELDQHIRAQLLTIGM